MKAKLTHDQLYGEMPIEAREAAGYAVAILEAAELQNIRLIDCIIGEIEEKEGFYYTGLSLSNPNKLPMKVAFNLPNESHIEYWEQLIGKENIIQ